MSQQKNMNEFIISFLTEYASEALDMWNSEENQSEFLNIINNIAKKSKAAGKKKSSKDPNKPKRGSSAYIFFCGDTRAKIKKDHPDFNTKQLTAELGVRWAALKATNPRGLKKYNDMAVADKARYEREMESYVPSESSDENAKQKKSSKTKKDTSKPKRGKSAYIFFCMEQRPVIIEENPDITPKEIMAELSLRWTTLKDENEEELARFQELARQDKIRYETEMTNSDESDNVKAPKPSKKSKVVKQSEEESEEESEEKSEKESEESEEESENKQMEVEEEVEEEKVEEKKKSKKGKTTAYILFCKDKRQEVKEANPEMKATEVTKELSKMWKNLPGIQKMIYTELLKTVA